MGSLIRAFRCAFENRTKRQAASAAGGQLCKKQLGGVFLSDPRHTFRSWNKRAPLGLRRATDAPADLARLKGRSFSTRRRRALRKRDAVWDCALHEAETFHSSAWFP